MRVCLLCGACLYQKTARVHNFPPAILGPAMATPILWALGILGFFLQETSMLIIFSFRWQDLGFVGGGSVPMSF